MLWCLALVAAANLPIGAQTIAVGDRVRLTLPEKQRQDESAFVRRQYLRGDVTAVSGDTVVLRVAPGSGETAIPLSSALQVDRSLGVRSRPVNALRVGALSAVLLASYTVVAYSIFHQQYDSGSQWRTTLGWAGVGFAAGAIEGALLPTERWERVAHR
jgi:hypothetical protein